MASVSAFHACSACNRQVSNSESRCPHCGAKQKKLRLLHWAGIALGVLVLVAVFSAPETEDSLSSSGGGESASATSSSDMLGAIRDRMPRDQVRFIEVVSEARDNFSDANNELQESRARDQRREGIDGVMDTRRVNGWVGSIKSIRTNSEGKGVLSVRMSPDIDIRTWNNAFSDLTAQTLIEKSDPVYETLMELERGQLIEFSGNFFRSDMDSVEETSLTIGGSMRSPEFLFNFKHIRVLTQGD